MTNPSSGENLRVSGIDKICSNQTSERSRWTIQQNPVCDDLWPERAVGKNFPGFLCSPHKIRLSAKAMAASITLQALQGALQRSRFFGQNLLPNRSQKAHSLVRIEPGFKLKPCAKFDLLEVLGGRGLCNGEKGIEQELKKNVEVQEPSPEEVSGSMEATKDINIEEDAFEKELMGLTGGFPGGENGLKKFIAENPPPKKQPASDTGNLAELTKRKPKPPELPILLPGMIAIVKNPNNPFYMYTGIVQRITDGKAAVLFEGGIWDRLVTFRLEELERRDKGPPGKNPKSAVLEALVQEESR